jgi:phosphatidylserine decarboxylase
MLNTYPDCIAEFGCIFAVKSASNLPRWRNMTRTGWDMDPFCIISFGQKVFRTRVIRHSRNPVWDERLFFHVQRHEHAFQMLFTLFDWDKISSNVSSALLA